MSECSQILLGPSFSLLLVIMLVLVIADSFFVSVAQRARELRKLLRADTFTALKARSKGPRTERM